ncbi:hypothetical protein QE152_g13457 [Popillia japonica]|uniref:Uncharacterized protein n=1 Tax=Popillia japonica TaxID=7064 RepID=A0AAW1LDX0_POPJA
MEVNSKTDEVDTNTTTAENLANTSQTDTNCVGYSRPDAAVKMVSKVAPIIVREAAKNLPQSESPIHNSQLQHIPHGQTDQQGRRCSHSHQKQQNTIHSTLTPKIWKPQLYDSTPRKDPSTCTQRTVPPRRGISDPASHNTLQKPNVYLSPRNHKRPILRSSSRSTRSSSRRIQHLSTNRSTNWLQFQQNLHLRKTHIHTPEDIDTAVTYLEEHVTNALKAATTTRLNTTKENIDTPKS